MHTLLLPSSTGVKKPQKGDLKVAFTISLFFPATLFFFCHLFPISVISKAQSLQTVTLATTASSTLEQGHSEFVPCSTQPALWLQFSSPSPSQFLFFQKASKEKGRSISSLAPPPLKNKIKTYFIFRKAKPSLWTWSN